MLSDSYAPLVLDLSFLIRVEQPYLEVPYPDPRLPEHYQVEVILRQEPQSYEACGLCSIGSATLILLAFFALPLPIFLSLLSELQFGPLTPQACV